MQGQERAGMTATTDAGTARGRLDARDFEGWHR
jgi:hypothetical protein